MQLLGLFLLGRYMSNNQTHIDWDLIGQLAKIQCTEEEIAFVLKCSSRTLRNHAVRTQGCTFEDYLEQYRADGRMSLRRKQFEIAMSGDKTLLIWLGKQYLGQSDKQEVASTVSGNIKLSAKDLSDDELRIIAARGRTGVTAPTVGPLSSN